MAAENDNHISAWSILHREVVRALDGEADKVRVFPCDLDEHGAFVRFAGVESALSELRQFSGSPEAWPAILIVGLFPSPSADAVSLCEKAATALLDWTGAGYLRYGFDQEALKKAAGAVIRGAQRQSPCDALAKTEDIWRRSSEAEDIRRGISEVRHWLENRLRNIDGARVALEAELRGEAALHNSHLEPVAAMSEAHRRMIERLWTLGASMAWWAPKAGGMDAIRDTMTEYELRWAELEHARAALRMAPEAKRNICLNTMRERLLAVRDVLAVAIDRMDVLGRGLSAGDRKDA